MIKSFFSNKRNVIIFSFIIILILIIVFYFIFVKNKNYNAFIELSLPFDSYGEVVYSPGNNYEFNLYVNSFLNIESSFSDGREHEFIIVIEDENVISLENNMLVAKEVGKTDVYIITKDDVKSNVISLEVIEKEAKDG